MMKAVSSEGLADMHPNIYQHIHVKLVWDYPDNQNRAPHNRNLAVEKMVRSAFDCELVVPEKPVRNFSSRLIKAMIRRLRLVLTIKSALSKIGEKNYSVLFLRSDDPFVGLMSWFLSKPRGVKLAIERNEFPAVFIEKNLSVIKMRLYKLFILPWYFRLFDVMFLMTEELSRFYGRHCKTGCIISKLPMTVDFSRFECEVKSNWSPYICYAGGLSEKKDGVESLIRAFKEISKKWPDINLMIAGGSNDGTRENKFRSIIKTYQLEDRVSVLGYVNRDDIPRLLCSAKILVLPRPDSLQARGGFPTKLGEYLATGKPVIVTRIGEIAEYLTDNEVFFISPHNIVDELAAKFSYILSHYDEAMGLAARGKCAAKKHFSLESNQHIIKDAFETLVSL